MTSIDIFELLYEPLKLKPPIKMFEAFSGIGTQAMALKRLGVPYEIVGFSEIDKYAIQSYHAIHGDIKNYGDITKMTEIPSCDIFTWSFPCTDLSKAGKRQGMTKDTRSGLVYEVLRLVRDSKDKPKVLIMENVPDLIQATFVKQFADIQYELETYGYMNYVETLNSKDFGVAQNRNRVFMVSILGEYSYNFPQPFKLEKRLKDYLEHDVDEKYYLDTPTIERISKWNAQQDPLERARTQDEISHKGMIQIIKTSSDDIGVVVLKNEYSERSMQDIRQNIISENDVAKTLTAQHQRPTINGANVVYTDLRIRKLTPRETWRLMGCSDDDFDKAQAVCSNSQLYKQAGNAIVVDVFEHILRSMI